MQYVSFSNFLLSPLVFHTHPYSSSFISFLLMTPCEYVRFSLCINLGVEMLECNVKPSSALVHIANLLSDMVVPNIFISNMQEFLFFFILEMVFHTFVFTYLMSIKFSLSDEYKVFPSFHMFFGHSSLQLMFIFFTHFFPLGYCVFL